MKLFCHCIYDWQTNINSDIILLHRLIYIIEKNNPHFHKKKQPKTCQNLPKMFNFKNTLFGEGGRNQDNLMVMEWGGVIKFN